MGVIHHTRSGIVAALPTSSDFPVLYLHISTSVSDRLLSDMMDPTIPVISRALSLNFDLATDPAAFLQLSYHLMTLCIAFSNSCVITSSSRLPSKMRDMDDGAKETLRKKPNFS